MPPRRTLVVPGDVVQQHDGHDGGGVDLVLGQLDRVADERAGQRAEQGDDDRRRRRHPSAGQQHQQHAAEGQERAVGSRRANSVLPNSEPETRSRKYQPAGNGAPMPPVPPPASLRAAHQFPEFEM